MNHRLHSFAPRTHLHRSHSPSAFLVSPFVNRHLCNPDGLLPTSSAQLPTSAGASSATGLSAGLEVGPDETDGMTRALRPGMRESSAVLLPLLFTSDSYKHFFNS